MSQNIKNSLRVGIAGAGLMGRWHAEYARRAGAQVVAIADQDLSCAESLAARESAQAFSGIDDMLEKSELDILHICTPLASHFPLALQAIKSGTHVFVEKPLTESIQETRLLLSEADKKAVLLCPVYQFGFQEGVYNARSGLSDAGQILQARFTICSAGGAELPDGSLDRIVADILPHPLSVLRTLWPQISLSTQHWSVVHPRDGELSINAVADEIGLSMFISMHARPTRCELDLLGSQGRIHVNFFHGYSTSEQGSVSRKKKIIQPFHYAGKELAAAGVNITKRGLRKEPAYPGLPRLIKEFYTAVKTGSPAPISADDILAVARARDELIAAGLLGLV